ncbi:hypothetical protein ACWEO1_37700 [Kitasatospora cineracea]
MDVIAWALVPVVGMLVAALTAVLIAVVALKGTASRERAAVLRAVADVVRAVYGRRTRLSDPAPYGDAPEG